MFKQISRVS